MKQQGNCITGDPILLENFTSGWHSVKLHPALFYRREDSIKTILKNSRGFYVEIDMGEYVLIKFSEKDDLTEFYRLNNEYI